MVTDIPSEPVGVEDDHGADAVVFLAARDELAEARAAGGGSTLAFVAVHAEDRQAVVRGEAAAGLFLGIQGVALLGLLVGGDADINQGALGLGRDDDGLGLDFGLLGHTS